MISYFKKNIILQELHNDRYFLKLYAIKRKDLTFLYIYDIMKIINDANIHCDVAWDVNFDKRHFRNNFS